MRKRKKNSEKIEGDTNKGKLERKKKTRNKTPHLDVRKFLLMSFLVLADSQANVALGC